MECVILEQLQKQMRDFQQIGRLMGVYFEMEKQQTQKPILDKYDPYHEDREKSRIALSMDDENIYGKFQMIE